MYLLLFLAFSDAEFLQHDARGDGRSDVLRALQSTKGNLDCKHH